MLGPSKIWFLGPAIHEKFAIAICSGHGHLFGLNFAATKSEARWLVNTRFCFEFCFRLTSQGRRVKRTGNSASVTPAKLFSSAIDKIDNAQGACTLHYFLFLPIYVLVAISEKVWFLCKFFLTVSWIFLLSLLNQNDKAALGLASASSVSGSVTYFSQYLTWKRKKNRPTKGSVRLDQKMACDVIVYSTLRHRTMTSPLVKFSSLRGFKTVT